MRTRTFKVAAPILAALAFVAGCSSYQPLTAPSAAMPPGVELRDEGDDRARGAARAGAG